MKFIKIPLLLAVVIYPVFADETNGEKSKDSANKIVIGVYGGASVLKMSQEYEYRTAANSFWQDVPGEYDKILGGFSWGVKIGYDLYFLPRNSIRLYADYMNTLFNSNDGTLGRMTMHSIGLNADYKFDIMVDLAYLLVWVRFITLPLLNI
ncbi:hypothetical protein DCO58_10100 [Helicobacter saguini]|uniref:Outer membrane protein beta-barrel domain-containing protein n=1 Tax=Helicobacter saguini TaxID=1548018 RepID=A0A347W5Q2_9HELI|nr:hypothetical protein [Helicobacter saguini]MWV61344.1 hypothetical protein [Helicobacter saguini]MWV67986.1 hypothetical protein [Helicobacter saguini]MWV70546.1 hypothetical protein [Helicobacter saguini]MWV72450.1 hypothetical protein [Helicobacter saguini]TLD94792.1 hypothetical protein LS64_004660 [Helicobacter saguini]